MVNRIENNVWKCPYCGKRHSDEDDAYECARDCIIIESPEEETIITNICEICKAGYDDYNDAYNCEQKHKEKKDLKYQTFLDELEKEKLIKAANKKGQRKLKL